MNQMTTTPSWQTSRSVQIRKVAIFFAVFVVVIVFVILVFTVPKCNATQVRGFFTCNCAPGSALDRQTGLCMCLNNGTDPGGQCEPGAEQVRYVFRGMSDGLHDPNKWAHTESAALPSDPSDPST